MRPSIVIARVLAPLIFAVIGSAPHAGGLPPDGSYDANSWKTLIADDCLAFFDGCNHCRRGEAGADAACTRKACASYRKPFCLGDNLPEGIGGVPFEGRLFRFTCDGDRRLRVYYDEYVSGDQRVRLAEDEMMLVDEQNRTAYRLERQRAASGAKWGNETLEFWEHGGEAMLRKNGQRHYSGCKVAG